MGKLPRKISLEKIKGYVIVHEKVFLKYEEDNQKELKEVILILAVENEEDKINLLALSDIFIQGFRESTIKKELDSLPQFDGSAPHFQKKALQVLLQHIINNQNDLFAIKIVGPIAKKYSLAKPKYMTKPEIQAMAAKMGMKSI